LIVDRIEKSLPSGAVQLNTFRTQAVLFVVAPEIEAEAKESKESGAGKDGVKSVIIMVECSWPRILLQG
jgi:hypothetical protein